jgi:amino-acid N-acetyltransferase
MPNVFSPSSSKSRIQVKAPSIVVRPARLSDASAIQAIIEVYSSQRLMLPRTLMQIYEDIRDYFVAEESGKVVGAGALHYFWEDLAELRALAMAESHKNLGIGQQIVLRLIEEARQMDVPSVFAFTYVPQFFERLGFEQVPHSSLPLKVWKDCINCTFFNHCNEIAMIKRL